MMWWLRRRRWSKVTGELYRRVCGGAITPAQYAEECSRADQLYLKAWRASRPIRVTHRRVLRDMGVL